MKKTLEYFKDMNKKNKIVLATILMGMILAFGAAAYAYFSVIIENNGKPLSVQTAKLVLELSDVDGDGIKKREINIGDTITKNMVIKNTGTMDGTVAIMWNELENTYLDTSLTYTIKQTREYNADENVDLSILDYTIDVPQIQKNVPVSEEPTKKALTRVLNIPAGKKIYYRVSITHENLTDTNQNADLNAQLSTSFTINEITNIEPFTITSSNLELIGYTGEENEELIIPTTLQDENGVWYKITGIGEEAFSSCYKLASVVIPDTVTSIGGGAFMFCGNLMYVTIGNGVTSIGEYAFMDCEKLTSVTIPANVTHMDSSPFGGCDSLTTIIVDEYNTNYKSIDGVIFTIDEMTLVQYASGKSNTSYTIPDSVTTIGEGAFMDCNNLTTVTIPDGTTSIESWAFNACRGLTSISIPNSITSIGENTFDYCTSLTTVTILNGVTSIGDYAFGSCENLTSITLGTSVASFGNSVFYGCKKLTSIDINEGNPNYKSIDGVVYTKDEKGIVLYPTGKSGAYTILDGVTSIGNSAFYWCNNLTSVTIPDSVTSIGDYAFQNCFYLASVTMGNGVISIGNYAFDSCSIMISIIIPNSVTSIGDYAFSECKNLTSITIPESVTSIGKYAFCRCEKLSSVTYKNTTYRSQSAFNTAFTSTSGNTIGTNVFNSTKLTA